MPATTAIRPSCKSMASSCELLRCYPLLSVFGSVSLQLLSLDTSGSNCGTTTFFLLMRLFSDLFYLLKERFRLGLNFVIYYICDSWQWQRARRTAWYVQIKFQVRQVNSILNITFSSKLLAQILTFYAIISILFHLVVYCSILSAYLIVQ